MAACTCTHTTRFQPHKQHQTFCIPTQPHAPRSPWSGAHCPWAEPSAPPATVSLHPLPGQHTRGSSGWFGRGIPPLVCPSWWLGLGPGWGNSGDAGGSNCGQWRIWGQGAQQSRPGGGQAIKGGFFLQESSARLCKGPSLPSPPDPLQTWLRLPALQETATNSGQGCVPSLSQQASRRQDLCPVSHLQPCPQLRSPWNQEWEEIRLLEERWHIPMEIFLNNLRRQNTHYHKLFCNTNKTLR